LFDGSLEILEAVKAMGLTQTILSASELNNLKAQTNLLKVEHYFDDIMGISNIYAESKLDIGRAYIKNNRIEGKVVLIGDTVHDYEVSEKLNVECILISNGHQHKSTLLECGVLVLDDISEVLEAIA